jgi:hypothetical protein
VRVLAGAFDCADQGFLHNNLSQGL